MSELNEDTEMDNRPEYIKKLCSKSKALSVKEYHGDSDCQRYIILQKAIAIFKDIEPKWFSTSKPLPDGDYGWRIDKNDKNISLLRLSSKNPEFKKIMEKQQGEWCRIVFPK